MIKAYIIVENQLDVDILKKLLPHQLVQDTEFIAASSQYNAQSLATTILALREKPVALVINAGTENESLIQEKYDLLYELLRQSSPGIPFQVFIAIPELEIILVQERYLLEKLIDSTLTDVEWQFAKINPKKFIKSFLENTPYFRENLWSHISVDDISNLQQHPLISNLIHFLKCVHGVTPLEYRIILSNIK